jgi:hypothetical protein
MKSKKLILALTMTIAMGLGVTAYASTESTILTTPHQRVGLGRVTGVRGYDYVEAVLKDKLGMTDAEITAGFNSGKTMYDLAKEKGITEDEFKASLLEERNKAIDKSLTDGTITKDEAYSLKETLKTNIDNCIGIPGQRAVNGSRGKGIGHMSGGGSRGLGNCYINSTVE